MLRLKDNAYKSYSLCKMQESDFVFVKTFLDTQRAKLEHIEFFYPYKDEELQAVLKDGCFWGLFDNDKLIATFAIDLDEAYAKTLADLINSFNDIGIERAYESSGLMVDEEYRGQGIARYMMNLACEEASRRGIAICGVVHTQNVASMATFFSLGFEMRATWHMSEGYDFIYLLWRRNCKKVLQLEEKDAKIEEVIGRANTHTKEHNTLLSQGYVGVGCKDTTIFFRKKEKSFL